MLKKNANECVSISATRLGVHADKSPFQTKNEKTKKKKKKTFLGNLKRYDSFTTQGKNHKVPHYYA